MSQIELTTESLRDMIKDVLGSVIAEQRDEAAAKGREAQAKPDKVAEELAARAAEQQAKEIDAAGSVKTKIEKNKHSEEMTLKAARFARCVVLGHGNIDQAVMAAKRIGDLEVATQIKAMGEELLASGGALVPPAYAEEVIRYMRAQEVVVNMGCRLVPLANGQMSFPKVSAGATMYWVGENQRITASELSTGEVSLREHKACALVPVSNELLRHSSPMADEVIRDDMVQALAEGVGAAFIRGLGTANSPKGLYYQVASANRQAAVCAGTTSTLAEITSDLAWVAGRPENSNIPVMAGGFIFSPRTKWRLMTIQTSNGDFAFKDEMVAGSLLGFRFASTGNIPNNLGGGYESEVYFADFSRIMIGDGQSLRVEAFNGGAYYDGSAVVSGITRDQTVIRAIHGTDIAARQSGNEIGVLTTVKWY